MEPARRVAPSRRLVFAAPTVLLLALLTVACRRVAAPRGTEAVATDSPTGRLSPQDTVRDGIFRPTVRRDFRLTSLRPHRYTSYDFLDPDVRSFLGDSVVNVPEFHDAQRLRKFCTAAGCPPEFFPDDEMKLTAVAGLAAAVDSDFEQPNGREVGMLHVAGTLPVPEFGVQGRSSNPVRLRKTPGVDEWFADVYDGLSPSTTPSKTFVVDAVTMGSGNDTVPAVAQWDWSDRPVNAGRSSAPLAGFRCGRNRWCEFGHTDGRPGFSSQNRFCGSGDPFTCRIKGWYDDQQLAVKNAAGQLVPGPYAVIFPVPDLQAVAIDVEPTVFTRVATIRAERGYSGAVRLEGIHPWARDNEVYLTKRRDGNFYFKIVRWPREEQPVYEIYRAYWHDHRSDGKWVPPIVRWGWLSNDEGLWTPCSVGCCELQALAASGTGTGPAS